MSSATAAHDKSRSASQRHRRTAMFVLTIGVGTSHHSVPYDREQKYLIEGRLRERFPHQLRRGLSESQEVYFEYEGRWKDKDVVSKRVEQVLQAAEVPSCFLVYLGLWTDALAPEHSISGPKTSSTLGGCNFHSPSIHKQAKETGIQAFIHSQSVPFTDLLDSFQMAAEEFMLLMTILKRVQQGKHLMDEGHNYAAAGEKLGDIPLLVSEACEFITREWRERMRGNVLHAWVKGHGADPETATYYQRDWLRVTGAHQGIMVQSEVGGKMAAIVGVCDPGDLVVLPCGGQVEPYESCGIQGIKVTRTAPHED